MYYYYDFDVLLLPFLLQFSLVCDDVGLHGNLNLFLLKRHYNFFECLLCMCEAMNAK